jgi:hypothetical protein
MGWSEPPSYCTPQENAQRSDGQSSSTSSAVAAANPTPVASNVTAKLSVRSNFQRDAAVEASTTAASGNRGVSDLPQDAIAEAVTFALREPSVIQSLTASVHAALMTRRQSAASSKQPDLCGHHEKNQDEVKYWKQKYQNEHKIFLHLKAQLFKLDHKSQKSAAGTDIYDEQECLRSRDSKVQNARLGIADDDSDGDTNGRNRICAPENISLHDSTRSSESSERRSSKRGRRSTNPLLSIVASAAAASRKRSCPSQRNPNSIDVVETQRITAEYHKNSISLSSNKGERATSFHGESSERSPAHQTSDLNQSVVLVTKDNKRATDKGLTSLVNPINSTIVNTRRPRNVSLSPQNMKQLHKPTIQSSISAPPAASGKNLETKLTRVASHPKARPGAHPNAKKQSDSATVCFTKAGTGQHIKVSTESLKSATSLLGIEIGDPETATAACYTREQRNGRIRHLEANKYTKKLSIGASLPDQSRCRKEMRRGPKKNTRAHGTTASTVQEMEDESPKFAYAEVVRKREERSALPAYTCLECQAFANAMTSSKDKDGNQVFDPKDIVQACSRHRSRFTPPSTPQGFWELSFADE